MTETKDGDLGFRYRAAKRGEVVVHHRGRLATTLRGAAAEDFLLEVGGGLRRTAANHGAGHRQLSARVSDWTVVTAEAARRAVDRIQTVFVDRAMIGQ
jgi:hypothetical protein